MDSPLIKWDSQGTPFSIVFDDMYFCAVNGYEDALYIFCGGNRLEERFKNLNPTVKGVFTIVETGFGTGLIFCVAWKLWNEHAPASWILNFLSIEKYPIFPQERQRALSVWPIVKSQADELAANYKVPSDKVGVFNLDRGRVRLTILFDDIILGLRTIAQEGLAAPWADALFLDGFSPAKNPEMWTENVFAGLARLSGSGTTLATFTVAGWVRRGLESQGFNIQKKTGYGCKNEMLKGSFLRKLSCVLMTMGLLMMAFLGQVAFAQTSFRHIPTEFIVALGDPSTSSGSGAQTWGLWHQDPGPRGCMLGDYGKLKAAGNVAPAQWKFDSKDWWLEEHGSIMEKPQFPLPAGQYVVTGGREVTAVLTIYPADKDGAQRWELGQGAKLYDVTHLPCHAARYTPATGDNSCSPDMAQGASFPVAPGVPMPAIKGCNKKDYSVLFVIGVGV